MVIHLAHICKFFRSANLSPRVFFIITYIWYLLSAYTNPGFLLGCSKELAQRAGAYDPKNFGFSERKQGEVRNTEDLDECSLEVIDQETVRGHEG